jgi:hypothetical protein
MGDPIGFLVWLGVIAVVVIVALAVAREFGFTIPRVVFIIIGGIIGILLIIWLGAVLPHLFSAIPR